MNILLYNHISLWKEHFEQFVELVFQSIEGQGIVYILNCDSTLISCPPNSSHVLRKCAKCSMTSNKIFKNLSNSNYRVIKLNLEKFNFQNAKISLPIDFRDLENYHYEGNPFGELVLSQLVDDKKEIFFDVEDFPKALTLLKNSIALYEKTKEVILDNKIDQVYAWNGRRSSDGVVLQAAKFLGREYFSFITGSSSNKIFRVKASKVHDYVSSKADIHNFLKVSNLSLEEKHNIGKKFFEKLKNKTTSIEIPGYINYNQNNNLYFTKKKARKNLVFFTSSPFELAYMKEWQSETNVFNDIFQFIRRLNSSRTITDKYDIYIRWHPNIKGSGKNLRSKISELVSETDNLIHFTPENKLDSYSLLDKSDVVIVTFSTMGAEAAYVNKPVILIGRSKYEDLGFTNSPVNFEELEKMLIEENFRVSPDKALNYAYYLATFGNVEVQNKPKIIELFDKYYYVDSKKLIYLPYLWINFFGYYIISLVKYLKLKKNL